MEKSNFMVELRQANISRDKIWDPNGNVTPSFRGLELFGEAGEAANIIKKLERERFGMVGSRAKVSDLAEELADVMISIDLIAMDYGIDMEAAIRAKFNKTSEKYGLPVKMVE